MPINSAYVFDVTEADFEEKVVKKSHEVPVVIDFWAPWCAPCKALGPILERMVEERAGQALLAKINTDVEQNLAMQFGISSIPHVVAFRKGHAVLQFTGLLEDAQMKEFFDRLQPSETEKRIEEAARLEDSDPAKAEILYRLAHKDDSIREDAIIGLARVLIAQKKFDEAADFLEGIGSGGEYGAEADRLRGVLWLQIQAKDLPDEQSLRRKVQANPKDAQSLCDLGCVLAANGKTTEGLDTLLQAGQLDRKLVSTRVKEAMVKIFFVVGARSELADAYRDKLTKLLY